MTISRQSGCGACYFAEKLAADLRDRFPQDPRPWSVFDRKLVEVVLEDHHMPARLAAYMPEDRVGHLHDIIEELFNLHPPTEILVRRTSESILHMAHLGHAIIVGRGGNVITARLAGVLHIRLVGSVEMRLMRLQKYDQLDKAAALERLKLEDAGRRRYLKSYFGKDTEDPLLYHLVINTDRVGLEAAAKMVGGLMADETGAGPA